MKGIQATIRAVSGSHTQPVHPSPDHPLHFSLRNQSTPAAFRADAEGGPPSPASTPKPIRGEGTADTDVEAAAALGASTLAGNSGNTYVESWTMTSKELARFANDIRSLSIHSSSFHHYAIAIIIAMIIMMIIIILIIMIIIITTIVITHHHHPVAPSLTV